MFFKKPFADFLFPTFNIILAIFLLRAFFVTGEGIVQTFPVAHMNALNYLKPQPMDYFWNLNINNAPLNRSRIRYYADYYEHLLEVFPGLRDAYGVLGYCYHYLGNDPKAIDYLKRAIVYDPYLTWNYYNLAVIYIDQTRFQDAASLLIKIHMLSPQMSLEKMIASQAVYGPLLMAGGQKALRAESEHLKLSYRVSIDLLQLIDQMTYNNDLAGSIKTMKLELYAF